MQLVLLIVAALAVGAALAFYWQYAALKTAVDGFKKSAEESTAALQKASKDRDEARQELTRRKSEAAELRDKLNEIRQRQYKARESTQQKKASNVVDELNAELADARRDLDEAWARNDVLARETAGMQADLTRAREERRKLEDALEAARRAAATAPAAVAGAAVGAAATAAVRPEKTEVDELRGRIQSLELQVREARRKAAEAEDAVKNVKGRLSTAQRMAQLQKSELDLFKEKLVWSEKRVVELERLLFDNKIALPEREPSPQPPPPQLAPGILAREGTNTGGEGVAAAEADYVPEEPPAPAPAEGEPPSAEAAAIEQPAAGNVPVAVPPLRRAKAAGEGTANAE